MSRLAQETEALRATCDRGKGQKWSYLKLSAVRLLQSSERTAFCSRFLE